MSLSVLLWIMAAGLAVAAVPVVGRMILGPTVLDRAVASDMLVVLIVGGLALYCAATGTTYAITGMLALTGLSFIGTLAVARFVSRDEPRGRGLLRESPSADGTRSSDGTGASRTPDTAATPGTADGADPAATSGRAATSGTADGAGTADGVGTAATSGPTATSGTADGAGTPGREGR
jgi:multicomponent Na+:H+ antiporter subunit F